MGIVKHYLLSFFRVLPWAVTSIFLFIGSYVVGAFFGFRFSSASLRASESIVSIILAIPILGIISAVLSALLAFVPAASFWIANLFQKRWFVIVPALVVLGYCLGAQGYVNGPPKP